MKSTFFKPLTTLFILILMVSCSIDSEENTEQLNATVITQERIEQQNLPANTQKSSAQTCGDVNLLVASDDFNFYYMYVEYEPNSTKQERNAIRNPYCYRMVSVTPCAANPNAEIWHIKGLCPAYMDCKPDIVKPTDPNLRSVEFSNTCISAPI